jgi:hypothetical protein
METCKTCKHWMPHSNKYPNHAREDKKAGGLCQSETLVEDERTWGHGYGADMLIYEYSEGGVFWTGPDFGCVHHQAAAAEGKFGAVEPLRQVVESAPEATP